jgi:adenosine kinase
MVTDLLAANAYKIEHLKQPHIWSLVEQAKYFYVGGYFLTVCPPAALLLAQHALETKKHFTLNLSAPFIPQFFKEPLNELLPFTDVVFGNETEARSFADSFGLNTQNVTEIALKIANLPKKNTNRPRLVVITQGSDETVLALGDQVSTFPIHPVASEKIIDTTGAGDAFAGGFLSQYVQEASIEQCVAAAHYLASIVIQRSGPTYPDEPHQFNFKN